MENKTKRRLYVMIEESLNKTYARKKGLKQSGYFEKKKRSRKT